MSSDRITVQGGEEAVEEAVEGGGEGVGEADVAAAAAALDRAAAAAASTAATATAPRGRRRRRSSGGAAGEGAGGGTAAPAAAPVRPEGGEDRSRLQYSPAVAGTGGVGGGVGDGVGGGGGPAVSAPVEGLSSADRRRLSQARGKIAAAIALSAGIGAQAAAARWGAHWVLASEESDALGQAWAAAVPDEWLLGSQSAVWAAVIVSLGVLGPRAYVSWAQSRLAAGGAGGAGAGGGAA